MKHIKNAVKSLIFLMILVVSLLKINQILEPKYLLLNSRWPSTSTYKQFYKMDENSIDVLFLGSSVVANAFIPQEIYNNYGIRSYNLGSEQQSIFISYYWLKESLRFQKPKVVVLDLKFMCDLHSDCPINMEEGLIRKSLDPMQWSNVKKEAIQEICKLDPTQSEMSYYLTNLRFHSRWTELQEYDFDKSIIEYSPLKGYAPLTIDGPDFYKTYNQSDATISMEFHPLMQEYLDKIVELCNDNNIQLVLIDLPGNEMNDAINNTHVKYAKQNNVSYYNLCSTEYFEKLNAVLPEDGVVNHQNYLGAIKTSNFIGGLLRDTYSLGPVDDQQYEDTKEYYLEIIDSLRLSKITDPEEYINAINRPYYAVFMSSYGDAAKGISEEMLEEMAGLGLTPVDGIPPDLSFVAVIIGQSVEKEVFSTKEINYIGSFRCGHTVYSINSNGNEIYSSSSIMIDGQEYSPKDLGLNIVVYDLNTLKVIDVVTILKGEIQR